MDIPVEMRKRIYDAVMYDTQEQREEMLKMMLDHQRDSISKGEVQELNNETLHLKRVAQHSATLALTTLFAAAEHLDLHSYLSNRSRFEESDEDDEDDEDDD